jgi:hypothetical protein
MIIGYHRNNVKVKSVTIRAFFDGQHKYHDGIYGGIFSILNLYKPYFIGGAGRY